jgi:hypothetical protein
MVVDLVDAVPEAIMRAQFRSIPVGLAPPLDDFRGAEPGSETPGVILPPAGVFAAKTFDERAVGIKEVVVEQRDRLIGDVVRRM